jgi:peptide/nickel transport system ATP-binding protein
LAGAGAVVTATELSIAGLDGLRASERRWRRLRGGRIGFVLQDALTSLDPLRTVAQEITEVLREHAVVPRRQYGARVMQLLTAVGIPDPEQRARQYPHELSGGLRQRALLATGLAGNPDLLIADEPTTALDVTIQAQILDLLAAKRDEGTALLVISHDLAVVATLADRVLVMRDGIVVEQGPTEQVLTDPRDPYTQTLLAAIPSAASRGRRLSSEAIDVTQAAEVGRAQPASPSDQAPSDTPLLAVRQVTKHFTVPGGHQRRRALSGVSLELAAGQKLGIVGESGSGKSTLARVLLGLIEPDEGEVLVRGQSWCTPRSAREANQLRHSVQFISQDPIGSFDPRYTVREVVGEPLRGVLSQAAADERVRALLAIVGLTDQVLDSPPRILSGGQAQRVAIARALALRPSVIICDEPVSALDVSIQAQVLDLLSELNSATGAALVFISHDLGVVHHLVDQVLVMSNGFIVEQGDVEDVFTTPRHPYTQQLVAAIPRLPGSAADPRFGQAPTLSTSPRPGHPVG